MEFRDRSVRLALCGAVTMIGGGTLVLLGLLHLALPLIARAFPETPLAADTRSVLIGATMYGAMGAALLWAGLGSIRLKRWSPPILLTIAWTWLLFGLLTILLTWTVLDDLIDHAVAGQEPLPDGVRRIVGSVVLGLEAIGLVLLPAALVWAYRDRDVLRTCRAADPLPGWSDRAPALVLGLAVTLGAAAVATLPLTAYAVFPFFGVLAVGPAGAGLNLATALACAWLARSIYRLELSGWWLATLFLVLLGLSTAWTFARVEPVEMLSRLGYPEQDLAAFRGLTRPVFSTGAALVTLLSLAYMRSVRPYFTPGGVSSDGLDTRPESGA